MNNAQVKQLHAPSDQAVILEYFVVEYRDPSRCLHGNCYGLMYAYQYGQVLRHAVYIGPRSGRPVTFSRLSDAERLCRILNGQEEAAC